MSTPPPWALRLGYYPPVPVTLDRADGSTTHYHTSVALPLGPPGQHVSHPATLAPDGSKEAGIGSIDGIVWHSDRTKSTTLSFTPFGPNARVALT